MRVMITPRPKYGETTGGNRAVPVMIRRYGSNMGLMTIPSQHCTRSYWHFDTSADHLVHKDDVADTHKPVPLNPSLALLTQMEWMEDGCYTYALSQNTL